MKEKTACQLMAEKQHKDLMDAVSELLREKASLSPTVIPTINPNNTGSWWKNEDLEKLRKEFKGSVFPTFPNMLPNYPAETQKRVKNALEKPDVPPPEEFVLPLWLGRDASAPIMDVLNHVYKNHGDLPVNGVFVVQDAIKSWIDGIIAADIARVYMKLTGMTVLAPKGQACDADGNWDIEINIKAIEFLSFEVDETHGTPLRITISVDSGDSYAICKEIHERGKLFITGNCDVERDDIVSFSVTHLCYLEANLDNEEQILLGLKDDGLDMPF